MVYFKRKADELLERIEKAKAEGIPVSEHSQDLKLVREYVEASVECATRLAPYIHPKIGAVPVPSDKTEEFVIVVPQVVDASDEWARAVNAKLINGNGSGSGK